MKNFLVVIGFLALTNCSKNETVENATEVSATLMEVIPEDGAQPTSFGHKESHQKDSLAMAKKIVKNGRMGIAVADINKAKKDVDLIIKKNGAYTQGENFMNSDTSEDLEMVIRVPHKNFDGLINSFSNGIGAVEYKNISAEDVTEEYTDVSIKLKNKKLYLEKYRDLLARAASTKDMLEIQEKIRNLEEEIDVAAGRLRYIDDRVNYSTLHLNLTKEKARSSLTSQIGFGSRFMDSVAQGWNIFVSFTLGLIALWPFLLLAPIVILLYRKWKRRPGK